METQQNLQVSKPKLNIGFFFLCLGLLITLITSVVSLINLIFSTLDKRFPDVLNATYQYGYSTYDYEGIRVALATLIIFFPIFIVVSFFWRKHIKGEMGHIDEIIKKWVVYIILFISAIVVAIDLVVLVRYFVSGEITNRFIYKVISMLLIALLVGAYYIVLLRTEDKSKVKKIDITFGCIAVLFFLIAVIYSFGVMGSPAKQRLLRLDDKRVNDLQSIQYQVINYWQQKEKLPEDLTSLLNSTTDFSLPVPPNFQKGERYEYTIKDEKKLVFELCGSFALPVQKGWVEGYGEEEIPVMGRDTDTTDVMPIGGVNQSWNHEAGRVCFERTIDKDIYPPFEKPTK